MKRSVAVVLMLAVLVGMTLAYVMTYDSGTKTWPGIDDLLLSMCFLWAIATVVVGVVVMARPREETIDPPNRATTRELSDEGHSDGQGRPDAADTMVDAQTPHRRDDSHWSSESECCGQNVSIS